MTFKRTHLGKFNKDIFASGLRIARLRAGLTQSQVADEVLVSPSLISKLERALVNNPDKYTLVALLRLFGDLPGVRNEPRKQARSKKPPPGL